MKVKFFSIQDIFWMVNALILSVLSFYLFSPGPEFQGGEYYICFILIYSIFVYKFKKQLCAVRLSPLGYVLGVIILLFSNPLFENDHYRYLFEVVSV